MKRGIITGIFICIFLATLTSSITIDYPSSYLNRTSSLNEDPKIQIAQLKYEPYPIEPGTYFDVWLKVKNVGNGDAKTVVIEFIPDYPFRYNAQKTKTIGSLPSRQEAVVKFDNIQVEKNALEGEAYLKFVLNAGGAYILNPITKELTVEIRQVMPILSLQVYSQPEIIQQGSTAKIFVDIKNLENSLVKDINLKLNLPNELIPIGSTTEKKIDSLLPDQTKTLEFSIMPDADAASKAYSIPINLTYYDETGSPHSKEDTLGILIGDSTDYMIAVEDSSTFSKNKKGTVTVSLSNIGPSDIKYAILELIPTKNYEVISNPQKYIGNLEPDDFETIEFEIFVKKSGNIPLLLKLDYKNNYNKKISSTNTINLKSFSSSELSRYGLGQGNNTIFNFIFFIALIIFIYIFFIEWKHEKNIPTALKKSSKKFALGFIDLILKLRYRNIKRWPRKIKIFLKTR